MRGQFEDPIMLSCHDWLGNGIEVSHIFLDQDELESDDTQSPEEAQLQSQSERMDVCMVQEALYSKRMEWQGPSRHQHLTCTVWRPCRVMEWQGTALQRRSLQPARASLQGRSPRRTYHRSGQAGALVSTSHHRLVETQD